MASTSASVAYSVSGGNPSEICQARFEIFGILSYKLQTPEWFALTGFSWRERRLFGIPSAVRTEQVRR
jgi:hypothetical protein